MKAIFGLGNIEQEYKNTRHNIGFTIMDWLMKDSFSPTFNTNQTLNTLQEERSSHAATNQKWREEAKLNALIARNGNILFIKPTNSMNNSGNCVKKIMGYYKILPTDILVIHDDIDQKIGNYKLIKNGGSGGHNGVEDIFKKLKTKEFRRLKIGIAPKVYEPSKHKAINFILKKFNKEEIEDLRIIFKKELRIIITEFIFS